MEETVCYDHSEILFIKEIIQIFKSQGKQLVVTKNVVRISDIMWEFKKEWELQITALQSSEN